MSRIILIFTITALFGFAASSLSSCGSEHAHNGETHEHGAEQAAVFQCPMKCEGDKTYSEAGKCPVCGMEIKEIDGDAAAEEGHSHDGEEGHEH